MSPDPICMKCRFLSSREVEPTADTSSMTCRAFPDGIPDKWLLRMHDKVQPGQQGPFVFERRKE